MTEYTQSDEQLEEEARTARESKLSALLLTITDERDSAIREKLSFETRALQDEIQVYDDGDVVISKEDFLSGENNQRLPKVHLTRTRVSQVYSRLVNLLLPSNERAFTMKPSPEQDEEIERITAEITSEVRETAQMEGADVPAKEIEGVVSQELKGVRQEAHAKARRMQRVIDDRLHECRFAKHSRRMLFDAVRLGTGVLKGPVKWAKETKKSRKLEEGVWQIDVQAKTQPAYTWTDYWNFYPHLTESIEASEHAYECHFYTRTQLRRLAKQPGFDSEAIAKLIKVDPSQGGLHQSLPNRIRLSGADAYRGRYVVWEGHRIIDREDLQVFGIDVPEDDTLTAFMCEVWFCDGKILKIDIDPLETEMRLPYLLYNIHKDSSVMWGLSIPYMCRDSQRSVDASWQMALYNGSLSAGFQIIRRAGVTQLAKNSRKVRGPTEWLVNDELQEGPVGNHIAFEVLPNTIEHILHLHDRSRANLDEEISMPLIAQGEPTEAQPTYSGLAMLMNAANVVLREMAVNWDDDVMQPAIQRLNEFEILYNERDDIKGDFDVQVHGATRLVVKDMQVQHLLYLLQIRAQDPELAAMMRTQDLIRGLFQNLDLPVDDILKTDEEMAEDAANRGEDPMVAIERERLELDKQKVQIEMDKAQLRAQVEMQGLEQKQAYNEVYGEEMARNDAVRVRQTEIRVLEKQYDMEIEMLKLAQKGELAAMDADTKTRIAELRESTRRFMKAGELQMWANEMAFKAGPSPDGKGV